MASWHKECVKISFNSIQLIKRSCGLYDPSLARAVRLMTWSMFSVRKPKSHSDGKSKYFRCAHGHRHKECVKVEEKSDYIERRRFKGQVRKIITTGINIVIFTTDF